MDWIFLAILGIIRTRCFSLDTSMGRWESLACLVRSPAALGLPGAANAVTISVTSKGFDAGALHGSSMTWHSSPSHFSSLAFPGGITLATGRASFRSVMLYMSAGSCERASPACCLTFTRRTTSNLHLERYRPQRQGFLLHPQGAISREGRYGQFGSRSSPSQVCQK